MRATVGWYDPNVTHRLGFFLLAAHLAVGALLPLAVFSRADGAMVCCAMEGRCDCAHSDASFARCTAPDSLLASATPPVVRPLSTVALAAPVRAGLLASSDADARNLFDAVPPTPPPRFAVA